MSLATLIISAFIAAWARGIADELGCKRPGTRTFARAIEIIFTGIAIGAGIQLLFRG